MSSILNQPGAPAAADSRPPQRPAAGSHVAEWLFVSRLKGFTVFVLVAAACFAKPLSGLVRFALHNDLYSHVLLVPFICGYLVWLKRPELELDSAPTRSLALAPFLLGLGLIGGYWLAVGNGWKPVTEDYLATMILGFVAFIWSGCFTWFGMPMLRTLVFPLAFLIFMAPFPARIGHGMESFLQHASASVVDAFMQLSGTPVLRNGTSFDLPGFNLNVAPECSGMHSTLVLFLTSLLAGQLLLRSNLSRTILVIASIPLGLLRNGFRIFLLGQLCSRLDPNWIDSPLHHRGGPVFFVISLAPFFLLLWYLRRCELKKK